MTEPKNNKLTDKDIDFVECRFAMHCKSSESNEDLHLIKEQITLKDGRRIPMRRIKSNYKRPFYVTKKGLRNHQDFKEWEAIENLDTFHSTQADLPFSLAKALGTPWVQNPRLRELCKSPYVFGVDVTASSLIKQSYSEKYPEKFTPFSIAAADTETDVVHGHGQILMLGIYFESQMFIAIQESYLQGYANPVERITEMMHKYLPEVIAKRKITFDIQIVPSEIEVVRKAMAKAHEWSPDFLAWWNMEFDVGKIEEACRRAEVEIADVLSDPMVPREFRSYKFRRGSAKKKTQAGRTMNFKPSQRWHTVEVPSGFYWMDAMCAYRQVRTGSAEEVSYGLDHILKRNKLGGKLKFEGAAHVEENGTMWHKLMQSKFPLEYVVYHAWDCISMIELDDKTQDLRLAMPNFAGHADFANFNSQPRKTMVDLHFFLAKTGFVTGSTASEMTSDMDEQTTDVKGWIVMLKPHLVADNGLRLIQEHPALRTNIRGGVADLDIAAAYPTDEMVMNISKETTVRELVQVVGVEEEVTRMQTINFSGGKTNAVEFCTHMLALPTMEKLLQEYMTQTGATLSPVAQPALEAA